MRALGLDHNNPHHEGYYRAMRVRPACNEGFEVAVADLGHAARTRRLLCTTG
jgi:hypothetical protein